LPDPSGTAASVGQSLAIGFELKFRVVVENAHAGQASVIRNVVEEYNPARAQRARFHISMPALIRHALRR
jgi:hypothetical protein